MRGQSQILPGSNRNGSTLVLESSEISRTGIHYLEKILSDIFHTCNRPELSSPVFMAVRELIQNATKAGLKRIVFDDLKINPESKDEYASGIKQFCTIIHSDRVVPYRVQLNEKNRPYRIRIDYINGAVMIQVISRFSLYTIEEKNIRQKFSNLNASCNLYEFYMRHSDMSEGAGMGIALVSFLLKNSGINCRNFTIFTDDEKEETVSRVIIPVEEDYISPREEFLLRILDYNLNIPAFRLKIQKGEVKLRSFPDN